MSLSGLILAGGKSSRMGFDKVNLNFHGERQLDWLHKLLQQYCTKTFVSGNPNKIEGDYHFIEDHYENGGPMNGIMSAFRLYPTSPWLIVPIDMPNVTAEVIEYLIEHRDENKVGTCFKTNDGNIEPFPVILESKAYPLLLSRFSNKNDSLQSFLKVSKAAQLNIPNTNWLVNINDQSQLKGE